MPEMSGVASRCLTVTEKNIPFCFVSQDDLVIPEPQFALSSDPNLNPAAAFVPRNCAEFAANGNGGECLTGDAFDPAIGAVNAGANDNVDEGIFEADGADLGAAAVDGGGAAAAADNLDLSGLFAQPPMVGPLPAVTQEGHEP